MFQFGHCGPSRPPHHLFVSFVALTLSLVVLRSASAMPIPTNIPRNKLTAAEASYLLQKDKNPIWLNAELEAIPKTQAVEAGGSDKTHLPVAPVIMRGDQLQKEVAFTFDDGPHAPYTPDLLQILLQYHVPATMFLVGTQCERYPYLVREEQKDGFSIGNHTYHHFSLTKIEPQYIGAEIEGCGDVINQITGVTPHLFRPPGGDYTPDVARMCAKLGYTTVLWTCDPGDFNKPSASVILARTLAKVGNGTIFLFHDGIPQTMEALPLMIDYLRINGYKIVSVDEMLKQRADDIARYRSLHKRLPLAWQPVDSFNVRE